MSTAVQKRDTQQRLTLRHLFDQQKPELAQLIPKTMSVDRLYRLALTECAKNPELFNCTAESWALALQTCAQQGLYPDSGLGLAYLIPRKGRVSFMRGYQGDLQLARNSGEIADIYVEVVYARDTFAVRKGIERTIIHEPYLGDDDPGPLRYVYAVARLKSSETAWVVLTRRDVDRHKRSAQGTERPDSPWTAHPEAMWKKTAIRELVKWLPKSTEQIQELARGDEPALSAEVVQASVTATIPVDVRPSLETVKDQLRGEALDVEPAALEDGGE